ncbi:MAG: hypothetical protein JW795_04700 [Chitinivibrionales bacterium]|nr:hypothetical protein [Chitinivibrionales bacterium]
MKKVPIAVSLGCVLLTFCAPHKPIDESMGISVSTDHQIVTKNDTLSIYVEDSIPWMAKRQAGQKPKKVDNLIGSDDSSYILVRVAQILPITVEGNTVQANDIVIHGNHAYIAYNTAGDLCAGALQIIDISTPDNPAIVDELKFATMDINALYVNGNKLVFGGQTDSEMWGFKSFVATLDPNEILIDNIINSIVGLSSHATSGITRHGNTFYVSVGAQNGRIEALNSDFSRIDSLLVDDVRDVESYQNGIILVAGTTDNLSTTGKVVIADANNLHNPQEFQIVDFGSDYHKATIEVYEGTTALLGLSAAGFQVFNLNTYSKIYEIANPVATATVKTNTNSVSSDGNLIFTANGGYGFRIMRPKNKQFESTEIIGFYNPSIDDPTETGYSANHIEFKSNYLFVASGSTGVQVYSLKKKN